MIRRFLVCLVALHATSDAIAQELQAVAALGRLEPEHGIVTVSAPSTPQAILGGILVELNVSEGDDVEAGQLLAVTDTAAVMQAMVQEAEAQVAFAQQEVNAQRGQETEACVRADVAANEAERRTRLQAQNVLGEEEAESARGEAQARKASCAGASANVKLAESGVKVAEAHLERTRAEAQRSLVRAPFAGRVLDIIIQPGELIGEAGILEMGRVSRMVAVAEVYESDIRYVSKGQRATVSSPALEQPLSGTVTAIRQKIQKHDEIGTDPAALKDARIVEVSILLDDPKPVMGLTNLQVNVVIHR